MEDLIMKIIDIEERAQEVISDAKKADSELEEKIGDETKKLHNDIVHKMEIKNAALRQMEAEDAQKRIEKIKAETKKQIAVLEEKFIKNKNEWADKIVENIIS